MKTKINSLILCICMLLFAVSCEKDFGDINKAWDAKVYEPSIPALLNSITSSLQNPGGTGNILTSWIYQNSQLAAMYAASGFRMDNFANRFWDNYFSSLANSRKLDQLIEADPRSANLKNVQAMNRTLIAYQTLYTTFIYGDMPYSQGGKAFEGSEFYRPTYDNQLDIVKLALNDLKWAIDNFKQSNTEVSLGKSDVLFNNDINKWIKFANSIRLRYALYASQKDAALANGVIAEALAKPLLEADEHYGLDPASITNYLNDRGGWYRGNSYVRMGSTMWNAMSSNNDDNGSGIFDLRCPIFFEPNKGGKWAPFPQAPSNNTPTETGNSGTNDPYAEARLKVFKPATGDYLYSPLNVYYVNAKTIPLTLIAGSEISFIKSEIYNRGLGAPADAAKSKSFYEEGIKASVKYWYKVANGTAVWVENRPPVEPPKADLDKMLVNPAVALSSVPATALSQIYKQHWISLFHQPIVAWGLCRRTDYATPKVELVSSSPGNNINRIIYPQSEIDGNYDNWRSRTNGTDSPAIKPWFMK